MLRTLRETFWVLALSVILMFGFFVALGAFDPSDVKGLSAAVIALVAAWVVHALIGGHAAEARRDAAAMRARERRGF